MVRFTVAMTLVLTACGDDSPVTDSGVAVDSATTEDSATEDSAMPDTSIVDTGVVDADAEPDAASLTHNVAFVTSTTHTGNLGGLAGADAICGARASEAGLPGTFVAWLSSTEADAVDRLGTARGWVRPDGKVVADLAVDLAAAALVHPIRLDELGRDVGAVGVWTGTDLGGRLDRSLSFPCEDWTTTEDVRATAGRADASLAWSSGFNTGCVGERHLYCLQIDLEVEEMPAVNSGRVAFLSSPYTPSAGGIDDADALCQADADAAGLMGTFSALLAPTGQTAASRFDTDGPPWIRPDGVRLADTAADFFTVEYWHAPLSVHADGSPQSVTAAAANGAATMNDVGEDAVNCSDWTSRRGLAQQGSTFYSAVRDAFGERASNCDGSSLRLYCLEN